MTEFKIWKKIIIGPHWSQAHLRKEICDLGYKIMDWPDNILDSIEPAETLKVVRLIRVSAEMFGLKKDITYENLCSNVFEHGLLFCKDEVGPQLRRQYTDQPIDDDGDIRIAMKPIIGQSGMPQIFTVSHSTGGVWLSSCSSYPETLFKSEDQFVFCLSS